MSVNDRINSMAERLTRLDGIYKAGEESAIPPEAFVIGLSRLSEEQIKRLEDYGDEELTSLIFGENDNNDEDLAEYLEEICNHLNDGIAEWDKACM